MCVVLLNECIIITMDHYYHVWDIIQFNIQEFNSNLRALNMMNRKSLLFHTCIDRYLVCPCWGVLRYWEQQVTKESRFPKETSRMFPGEEIYFNAATEEEKNVWVHRIFLLTKQRHEPERRKRSSKGACCEGVLCLYVCLHHVCKSVYMFVCLYSCLQVSLLVCLPVCLSGCMSV